MPHALPTDRRWTADDLDELDGLLADDVHNVHYECVDGHLIPMAPTLPRHAQVAQRLLLQTHPQLPVGWDLLWECGVRLGDDWRIPDLLVVPGLLVRGKRLFDPASVPLIVEVASESTVRTDRVIKPAEYADAGIPYYWRVEIEPQVTLVTYTLTGRHYGDPVVHEVGAVSPAAPFPLVVDLAALGR